MRSHLTTTAVIATLLAAHANAGVIEFIDREEWEAAVGDFTTIGFVFDETTTVTDQFADVGVLFPTATVFAYEAGSFVNDGWGIGGSPDILMEFAQPMSWIAVDFPGPVQFDLLSEGDLIYTSHDFGSGGVGFFAGLVSDEAFDAVRIFHPGGTVHIDDLHFGPPIPAPAGALILALPAMLSRRRRSATL